MEYQVSPDYLMHEFRCQTEGKEIMILFFTCKAIKQKVIKIVLLQFKRTFSFYDIFVFII